MMGPTKSPVGHVGLPVLPVDCFAVFGILLVSQVRTSWIRGRQMRLSTVLILMIGGWTQWIDGILLVLQRTMEEDQ